jgi:hypothetical protein
MLSQVTQNSESTFCCSTVFLDGQFSRETGHLRQ